MDQDLDKRLIALEKKVDESNAMMKKIWRSYMIAFWITVALIVLPLIGLAFAIPKYLSTLNINSYLQ